MRKFKVIALSVGGNNNKIYKAGEIINEKCLVNKSADKLIQQGFLEEIIEEAVIEEAVIEKVVINKVEKKRTYKKK